MKRAAPPLLLRLLSVLALVLFGAPHGPANATAAPADPIAERLFDATKGILTIQPHQMRAPLTAHPGADDPAQDDPTPDTALPARTAPTHPHAARRTVAAPSHPLHPATRHIHPPVRGPPAA